MSMPTFLTSLWKNGRVRVPRWSSSDTTANECKEADDLIRKAHATDRLSLAFEPPELCIDSARWSAQLLYRICQLLIDRGVSVDESRPVLTKPCPREMNADAVYSVDLTMRYLPDVVRLARTVNPGDEIIEDLNRLAGKWVLSSVGMKDVSIGSVDVILSDRTLCAMYVDRILERGDRLRLEDPRVWEATWAAVGDHSELAIFVPTDRPMETQGERSE